MSRSKQRKGRARARQPAGLSQGRRLNSMQVTALPLASAIIACLNPAQAQEAASAPQAASAPGAASAPEAASGTLADIVVTAQKRSESIQDVPLSITALGAQQLDEMNAKTVDDYIKYLPSVSYQTTGPGSAKLYMRGVSSGGDGVHSGSLPSVGVYLDEQPVTTIEGMLNIHIYDIERVEALAGPQGTLYGASSEAGTLRIITNKPQFDQLTGAYEIQANDVDHGGKGYTGEGFINIPIGSSAALRLVGWDEKDAGYLDNVPGTLTYPATYANGAPGSGFTESNEPPPANPAPNTHYYGTARNNYNTVDTFGGRAALRIALGDNWTITPTVQGQETNSYGIFAEEQTKSVPGYPGLYPSLGDLQVQQFQPQPSTDHWTQATLTIEGKISDFDVTYAGGFLHRTTVVESDYNDYSLGYALAYTRGPHYFTDNAGQPINPAQQVTDSDGYKMYSHEIRVSTPKSNPVHATFGAFTARQTDAFFQNFTIPGLSTAESVTDWPGVYYLTDELLVKRDNAAFGEVTWDVTSHISLLAGLRYYTYDNSEQGYSGFKSAQAECVNQAARGPFGGPCEQIDQDATGSGTTPKFTATYKFDDQRLVYATFSKGFRPGGPNTIGPQYQSDTLINYEVGWKTSWLDNSLRVNGAIFQEDWKDFQFSYQGPNGIVLTRNAGEARIRGIETSIDWAATSALTFGSSITWLDPILTEPYCQYPGLNAAVQTTNCYDYSSGTAVAQPFAAPAGQQLPTSPKFKGDLTARYSFPLANQWEGHAQGGLVYQSFVWSDLRTAQREAIGEQPAYALFDAKVGAQKGGIGIELFVDNLFDRRAENYSYAECNPLLCGQQTIYHNIFPPRTVGVKFTQKF